MVMAPEKLKIKLKKILLIKSFLSGIMLIRINRIIDTVKNKAVTSIIFSKLQINLNDSGCFVIFSYPVIFSRYWE